MELELSPSQVQRFWSKVDIKDANECWIWLAGTDRRGYGLFSLNNKTVRAPRISIMLATGALPCPEHDACHSCDTPGCVNPNHLIGCTRQKNMQDASKRGRIRIWKQKLTHSQVREIRADPRMNKEIALDYGLDESTVSKIKHRKMWKNLPN